MKEKIISRGDLMGANTVLAPDCIISYSPSIVGSPVSWNFNYQDKPIGEVKSIEEILDKDGSIKELVADIDFFDIGIGGVVTDAKLRDDGVREITGFNLTSVSLVIKR